MRIRGYGGGWQGRLPRAAGLYEAAATVWDKYVQAHGRETTLKYLSQHPSYLFLFIIIDVGLRCVL